MHSRLRPVLAAAAVALLSSAAFAGQYRNFTVAVYIPVQVVNAFRDPQVLQSGWEAISRQVKVDKVYIETYRSRVMADGDLIERVKKFFADRGVRVAGGICYSYGSDGQFSSFCYTDPKQRDYVKSISEFTARHFDEIILDDFFFVNSKTDSDIAAKGSRTWTQFRLDLMDDVAANLLVGPAKAVNPKVKYVIKYPNWYEHFQGLGFDLDREPRIFDGIYAGTETRDPQITDQNLQAYESYDVVRFFEAIKPGGNGGGWVDTYDIRYVDRYAEQLWDTMFAKAREITLFQWGNLLDPIQAGERPWQGLPTSLNYFRIRPPFGGGREEPTMARVAGYALEQVDPLVGRLGRPIGIASYKPLQSSGEDFLHNYLGMIGIPIDLRPTFPADASTILLTSSASADPDLVPKIKSALVAGKSVVITSGLLHHLEGRGIEDISDLRYTDHVVAVDRFFGAFGSGAGAELGDGPSTPVPLREIRFLTNQQWPLVRGVKGDSGYPILLSDHYSKGTLYVLTVPESFGDLYDLPRPVLSAIKSYVMRDFPVRVDSPAKVGLFAYDNGTFVVESFLPVETDVRIYAKGADLRLRDLASGALTYGQPVPRPWWGRRRGPATPDETVFDVHLLPHSYLAFGEVPAGAAPAAAN